MDGFLPSFLPSSLPPPSLSSFLPPSPSFLSFFLLAMPCSLQDLSSPTRERTQATAVKAPSPNHWTAREFPDCFCSLKIYGLNTGPLNFFLNGMGLMLFNNFLFFFFLNQVFKKIYIYLFTWLSHRVLVVAHGIF